MARYRLGKMVINDEKKGCMVVGCKKEARKVHSGGPTRDQRFCQGHSNKVRDLRYGQWYIMKVE